MVGEFPELQGLMGKYYAEAQGEDEAVAHACEDHYKPKGPDDLVPADPVSIAVALADKIDTLVGFWAIDEKPTGSKDPYALRRAALGVIRIILDNSVRVRLMDVMIPASSKFLELHLSKRDEEITSLTLRLQGSDYFQKNLHRLLARESKARDVDATHDVNKYLYGLYNLVFDFMSERLKVVLRERGARHDLVDSVFALEAQDDLLLIVRRVEVRWDLSIQDARASDRGYNGIFDRLARSWIAANMLTELPSVAAVTDNLSIHR